MSDVVYRSGLDRNEPEATTHTYAQTSDGLTKWL